mmetsp:Transcript_32569/g.94166  ORF Transcript_32569/g.94166 Transcript_32569/m.94166 type:complete len:292 (-) Transcript_32569:455-1330(-)
MLVIVRKGLSGDLIRSAPGPICLVEVPQLRVCRSLHETQLDAVGQQHTAGLEGLFNCALDLLYVLQSLIWRQFEQLFVKAILEGLHDRTALLCLRRVVPLLHTLGAHALEALVSVLGEDGTAQPQGLLEVLLLDVGYGEGLALLDRLDCVEEHPLADGVSTHIGRAAVIEEGCEEEQPDSFHLVEACLAVTELLGLLVHAESVEADHPLEPLLLSRRVVDVNTTTDPLQHIGQLLVKMPVEYPPRLAALPFAQLLQLLLGPGVQTLELTKHIPQSLCRLLCRHEDDIHESG